MYSNSSLKKQPQAGDAKSFPLSYGQQAMWFLYQIAPQSIAYNIYTTVQIGSELYLGAWRRAWLHIVERHPILRTTYRQHEDQPVQVVHPYHEVDIKVTDASSWDLDYLNKQILAEAERPYNLETGPVLRVHLFTRSATEHIQLLAMHHIAGDMRSFDILLNELQVLYTTEAKTYNILPVKSLSYTDYVRWQTEMLASSQGEQLSAYWQKQLAGELPILDLPVDKLRPSVQTYCGATHTIKLDEQLLACLRKFSESEQTSLYRIFLAAFFVLLYRLSGQQDILVGCPVAGRSGRKEFENIVGYFTDPVAVVYEGEQLTYSELNTKANQLAHYLQKLGVRKEVLVGICVERSPLMLIGLLGILKAGGAYVPLDPAYPAERLAYMLNDSQAPVLLTQRQLVDSLPLTGSKVICLDTDWELIGAQSEKNPHTEVKANNLAYVIYTSGSTGKPKGVMIEHRSSVNFTLSIRDEYRISASDRVLQAASISFDAAVEEIYPCLTSGATLVLRTAEMLGSVSTFVQKCWEWKLTIVMVGATYWHQLTSELATTNDTLPPSVRLLSTGGEKWLPEKLKLWQKCMEDFCRAHNLKEPPLLINGYGPTEATVLTTIYDLSKLLIKDTGSQQLIGKALGNVRTYILDSEMQPVPIGVPGELYIGGVGLARGYLNRPDITAEKFFSHPFNKLERLYKTGDKARYLPDGNIEFLGRIDNQVKIRGFRIELGEIETVLVTHPQVSEAVVIDFEDIPGSKRLVAYVVTRSQSEIKNQLRSFLKQRLPDYMVPSVFVILDALPLTPNGKVDLRGLPTPDQTRSDLEANYVAPQSEVERTIATVWQEVLHLVRIGIYDNFFEIGGHSLLATQVISRLRKVFQIELSVRTLFEAPTIASFAEYCEMIHGTLPGLQDFSNISDSEYEEVEI